MRLRRSFSPLYLSFPLILFAALALARYSYVTSQRLEALGEKLVKDSLKALGDQTAKQVETFIIVSDRELFNLVDLEHLEDFDRRWREIVRLSRAVEAALVLDEKLQVIKGGYVNKNRHKSEADSFLHLFMAKILPKIPLRELRPEYHQHLHITHEKTDYLFSYIKRFDAAQNRSYYIILKINLDYLTATFFPEILTPLQGLVQYSVIRPLAVVQRGPDLPPETEGEVLYGQEIHGAGKFLYEKKFDSTLYLWRLKMAPLESKRQEAGAHNWKVSELLLIGMMLGTIVIATVFLLYAIAKEHRANALKSEFISNVSHELKTPLSLIRMFGELLMLGKVKTPEKGREYAEIITRESERLSRLIDNVLDFSRIERGKAAYDMKPGDLGEVVERALDFYRYRLEREGRQLEVDVPPNLPRTLLDENAMTLVLLNLVDNALKYGGDSPITVRLRATTEHGRGELQLSVVDRGPGIPADEHRQIFERFYRARAVRKKNLRGSGIGLALVRHISEAHGGRVVVDSAPGQGATFTVVIPVRQPPASVGETGEVVLTGTVANPAVPPPALEQRGHVDP